jgi:histidyl-tRNA synthetase
MSQPSLPKGTRDFAPEVMVKRNYIFNTIRSVFERFGYQPLETPSMENLETLTGKYGEEGDQLIFKILNNGDYLKDVDSGLIESRDTKKLAFAICERALRYDLTVPFARFVAMNKNTLAFPFKRYQIQPVWRADRPQRGRYREFYQCDVDVVGSDSLVHEVELIQIFDSVLGSLKLPSIIKLNNRKVLSGIAEVAGVTEKFTDLTVAIDKLDKVGLDGVVKELLQRGFTQEQVDAIMPLFALQGTNESKMEALQSLLAASVIGMKGLEELRFIVNYVSELGLEHCELELDFTLARGLNYYTGAIFEVKAKAVQMGSICGGGRYDNLTGIFGVPGLSGVGISFGADRIYDVLNETNAFPADASGTTKVLFANFGEREERYGMKVLREIRNAGINAEMYPSAEKMKKQFKYADDKRIPFVVVIGEQEMEQGKLAVKKMSTGEQQLLSISETVALLSSDGAK